MVFDQGLNLQPLPIMMGVQPPVSCILTILFSIFFILSVENQLILLLFI